MRPLIAALGLVLLWEGFVRWSAVPPFLLPSPLRVADVLWNRFDILWGHALTTGVEILLGLLLGTLLGIGVALTLAVWRGGRRWVLPLLIASQAIPVFAIAPLLTLWLGFGLASKIAMATIIIFFPVATAFYDGLRRTEPGWLDLATTMGASKLSALWRIRVPAALPGLASGLRVATAVAPIGAVVGEWVGASSGLGYVMLQANGRSQTDMMFAALLLLATMAMALWFATDRILRAALPWQPDALADDTTKNQGSPA